MVFISSWVEKGFLRTKGNLYLLKSCVSWGSKEPLRIIEGIFLFIEMMWDKSWMRAFFQLLFDLFFNLMFHKFLKVDDNWYLSVFHYICGFWWGEIMLKITKMTFFQEKKIGKVDKAGQEVADMEFCIGHIFFRVFVVPKNILAQNGS